ncbi:hypothetical protein GSI_10393 [Ganoderma sinense ZZ0214-1]|uniref:Uncharacterized protein n=1 Tax=Ganoderma sinense ZZ0214-1 TaxID=1077348 RepID=A0A2G8S0F3_9APHY|nr:hypothetical protein GSI_10393 [Ganoderma sinense ZZ0214-1]
MTLNINSPVTTFVFPEPWENRLFGPIDQITVVVDRQGITVSFTVATGDFHLDNGKPKFFQRWLERIQGAMMSGTGITEEEHELLLHFALRYRAFYLGHEDIPEDMYYEFVRELVAETLTLQQPEPAGQVLETAVEWLLGHLPADVFDDPGIDIPAVMPYTDARDPDLLQTLANAPSDFSPTAALLEICSFLVPARTSYGDCALRSAYLDNARSLLRTGPLTSLSVERAYLMLPVPPAPHSDSDSGYTSDDSMPSLRYVADSSDEDDDV